jgi:RNA polymerase sigma factor (sigma-70 family)
MKEQSMSSQCSTTPVTFERFLCWLGPDAESAARKYESIRNRLIVMFSARQCVFAEDLADATFERVTRKLADLTEYTGDPRRYFYGVAKKIYLEYQHERAAVRQRFESSPQTNSEDEYQEHLLKQLDDVLNILSSADRELILRYYTGEGKEKINERRLLGQQFGLGPNALRLRVFRIRREIRNRMLLSGPIT